MKEQSATKLAECLRGELAAVETYELALKHIDHVGLHRTLQDILASHSRRVELIRDIMIRTGMDVPTSSGVWGAFAKTVQVGADLLSVNTAIAALEAGEDRGLAMYSADLDGLEQETQSFIATTLLPEQRRTHDLCRALKSYVKQPS
jgi:hypothetical protein